ncbi:MAG: class I SAM-dependent methyltransferase [Phycisphaeraceae bacterium]|nr:class I SAM-dependent methyltransferase [Phycisphaeraceae bacterium]
MSGPWQPFDWYRDVLYYDIIFDQTTDDEVRFLLGALARHGQTARSKALAAARHSGIAADERGTRRGAAGAPHRDNSAIARGETRTTTCAVTRTTTREGRRTTACEVTRATARDGPRTAARKVTPATTRKGPHTTSPVHCIRVLEPGCGSGRLINAFAQLGAEVLGFDIEPRALEYARRRLPPGSRARLQRGRFDDFRAPRESFDLAHCLYSTLLHATKPGEAEEHLRRVCDALAPGGLYVIGLHLSDPTRREVIRERADCTRRGVRVIYTLRHGVPDRTTRLQPMRCRLAIRRAGRTSVRRLESQWDFRTYDERQLRALLRSEPRFRLVATHDFHHDLDSLNEGRDASFDRVLILRRDPARARARK